MATKSLLTSSTFDDQLWRHSLNKYDLCPSLTFRPRPWPRDSPRFRSPPARCTSTARTSCRRCSATDAASRLHFRTRTARHLVRSARSAQARSDPLQTLQKRRLVSLNTAQSNNFKLLIRATCKIALVSLVVIQKRKLITICYTSPSPYQPDC